MAHAVRLLEVYGLVAAFVAGDAGCKAADVTMETFDKNKPANADKLPVPLLVTVKFRGSISAVRAAMDAAKLAAEGVIGVASEYVIPAPEDDVEKLLRLSALDKS